MNRRSRPYREYGKLLPEVFKQLNMEYSESRWSQKVGCDCGCSPGFILNNHFGYEVYVTIKCRSIYKNISI
jgi:hypothetical protein